MPPLKLCIKFSVLQTKRSSLDVTDAATVNAKTAAKTTHVTQTCVWPVAALSSQLGGTACTYTNTYWTYSTDLIGYHSATFVFTSVVVLEESPCPRGSSRTNLQALLLVLEPVLDIITGFYYYFLRAMVKQEQYATEVIMYTDRRVVMAYANDSNLQKTLEVRGIWKFECCWIIGWTVPKWLGRSNWVLERRPGIHCIIQRSPNSGICCYLWLFRHMAAVAKNQCHRRHSDTVLMTTTRSGQLRLCATSPSFQRGMLKFPACQFYQTSLTCC